MTEHRVDLQPPASGHGGDTMLLNGKIIGRSERPIYDAARWLLENNAALEDDTVATYRGGTLSMRGVVGELAQWTVVETKHGKPSLYLRRYEAYSGPRVASLAAETAIQATPIPERVC